MGVAMRYSLEQLEMLVAVARSGSFSGAARQLARSQSTVSEAMANFEIDLGVALFDRAGKLAALTPQGQSLLAHAQAVLERCREFEGRAQSLGRPVEARLTLAIEVPYNTVVPVLAAFAQAYPFVDLDIRHPLHGDVSTLVLAGEADLGISFAQANYARELGFSQMGKLILTHVASAGHPLAARQGISFAELCEHRRLVFWAHHRNLPTSEYLDAPRCWKAESYLALLEMTREGIGWTTLPRQLIRREIEQGELVELPLTAYPNTDWLVGVDLLWRVAAGLGEAGQWLKRHLEEHKIWEAGLTGHPTTR
jgi:DNA-binding transcriptional LysR family regulator